MDWEANRSGVNKPGGEQARGQMRQGANETEEKSSKVWVRISQGVNKPRNESAWHRGQISQEVKQQRGKKATVPKLFHAVPQSSNMNKWLTISRQKSRTEGVSRYAGTRRTWILCMFYTVTSSYIFVDNLCSQKIASIWAAPWQCGLTIRVPHSTNNKQPHGRLQLSKNMQTGNTGFKPYSIKLKDSIDQPIQLFINNYTFRLAIWTHQFLPVFQITDLKVSNFAKNCQIGDLKDR